MAILLNEQKSKRVGFGFVGLGDSLRGEKGERAKINVLQTFPPNPALSFLVVLLPSIIL
jgi:hypothetical protein